MDSIVLLKAATVATIVMVICVLVQAFVYETQFQNFCKNNGFDKGIIMENQEYCFSYSGETRKVYEEKMFHGANYYFVTEEG